MRTKNDTKSATNLRKALIQESITEIEKVGIHHISIRDIAKNLGVTHQAPYKHFKDKESLLIEVATAGLQELINSINNSALASDTFHEKIVSVAFAYFDFAVEKPELFRLIFGDYSPRFARNSIYQNQLMKFVEFGIKLLSTKLKNKEQAHTAAREIWASIHGPTILFINNQFQPLQKNTKAGRQLIENVIKNYLRGRKWD